METMLTERPAAGRRWQANAQLRWATRGAWAVLDQGMFAGSNFLMTILLARWLLPHEFGAFTVAYAVFLLAGTVHTALITEPLLVFGSGKYATSFLDYLSAILRGHWLLSSAATVSIGIGGVIFLLLGSIALGQALTAMALVAPLVLFSWLARRACITRLEPRLSAAAGGIYFVLMLIGLDLLRRAGSLSPATAFGVLGAASLVAAFWTVKRLGVLDVAASVSETFRSARTDHWRYGRWSLATGVLAWVPANILLLLLPAIGGLAASGVVKALTNLVLPILHANAAVGMLLLPALMRAKALGQFRRTLMIAGALLVGGSLAYWVLMGIFSRPLLDLLYQGQYTQYARLLWLLGALPVCAAVVAVLGAALRAMERPDRIFWAYTSSTLVSLTAGVWALRHWAVTGAVVGYVLSSMATCATLAFFLLQQRSVKPTVTETVL